MIARNAEGKFSKGNRSGTRFTSESSRGNQHAKGNLPNKTSFKKGVHTMERHACWKGGLQKHKDGYWVTLSTNKRVKRARFIYEQAYGEIPKGHVIYHLNGDTYDDDINNLQAITRAELIDLNRK